MPKSLQELAIQAAIRNKRKIDSVQGCPYAVIRPIMLKIDSPQQLQRLEESDPSIREETGELWRALIRRDCPSWENNPIEPKDPTKWHKIYKRVMKADEERIQQHRNALVNALKQEEIAKEQNITHFEAARKLPKGRVASSAPSKAPSYGPFGSMPKGKSMTGSSILDKARKEAREANALQRKAVAQQKMIAPTNAQSTAPGPGARPAKRGIDEVNGAASGRSSQMNASVSPGSSQATALRVVSRKRPKSSIFMSNPKRQKV